jgi:hypothetical protein
MLVFSTQLCDLYSLGLLPVGALPFSLVQPPPPLPCVNKYSVYYTYTMCKGAGGVWGSVGDHILQQFCTLYI